MPRNLFSVQIFSKTYFEIEKSCSANSIHSIYEHKSKKILLGLFTDFDEHMIKIFIKSLQIVEFHANDKVNLHAKRFIANIWVS